MKKHQITIKYSKCLPLKCQNFEYNGLRNVMVLWTFPKGSGNTGVTRGDIQQKMRISYWQRMDWTSEEYMYCIYCNLDMLTSILSSRLITPRRNYNVTNRMAPILCNHKIRKVYNRQQPMRWIFIINGNFSKIHRHETNDQLVYW